MTPQLPIRTCLAGLGLLGALASAATADVVVSNLANNSASSWDIGSTGATLDDSPNAIRFTTGPGPGWILESVTLLVGTQNDPPSGSIALKIAADSNGLPGANLLDFQAAAPTTGFEQVTFLPPQAPFTLQPNTNYWLVATADVADNFGWWYTTDTSESGLAGWSIGDDTYVGFPVGVWTVLKSAVPPVDGPAPQLFEIKATAVPAVGACCLPSGGCFVDTAEQCLASSGTYQGDGTTCEDVTCPLVEGACCFPDGVCLPRTELSCMAGGGTWFGAGTLCQDVTCPDPVGACCFPNGDCLIYTAEQCLSAAGVYQGDGTICEDVVCNPEGACCFPDGVCLLRTELSCMAGGGTWFGAGTSCEDVTCGEPVGACCLPSGGCLIYTATQCAASSGIYQGNGTACEDVNCNLTGACCFPDGVCLPRLESECAVGGGTWYGVGSDCEDVTCGACSADLNDDGTVNGADLGIMLSQWGGPGTADLDGSGTVDGGDLGILLAAWGPCP
ncbi:MAG: choice-of-anchor R domain-containing protein [Phycisphaerales bacterium]